jgi:hypothetical protein
VEASGGSRFLEISAFIRTHHHTLLKSWEESAREAKAGWEQREWEAILSGKQRFKQW